MLPGMTTTWAVCPSDLAGAQLLRISQIISSAKLTTACCLPAGRFLVTLITVCIQWPEIGATPQNSGATGI